MFAVRYTNHPEMWMHANSSGHYHGFAPGLPTLFKSRLLALESVDDYRRIAANSGKEALQVEVVEFGVSNVTVL